MKWKSIQKFQIQLNKKFKLLENVVNPFFN